MLEVRKPLLVSANKQPSGAEHQAVDLFFCAHGLFRANAHHQRLYDLSDVAIRRECVCRMTLWLLYILTVVWAVIFYAAVVGCTNDDDVPIADEATLEPDQLAARSSAEPPKTAQPSITPDQRD